MRALVTGATGMVGINLTEALAQEPDVQITALVRGSSNIAPLEAIGAAMRLGDMADPKSLVTVGWDLDPRMTPYRLAVTVDDRSGVIYKISKIMHALDVSIHDLTTHRDADTKLATLTFDIEPVAAKTYQKIISRLRHIKEVKTVH